jgi:hypothetical protein
MTVPLYSCDQEFQGHIPERYALKLEAHGVAQLVRQKGGVKKGAIRRVVMRRRPGDPKPTVLRDYLGQGYSYKHHLDDGHRPWALKPLGGKVSRRDQNIEFNLAPGCTRPIFLRVLLDCLVRAA